MRQVKGSRLSSVGRSQIAPPMQLALLTSFTRRITPKSQLAKINPDLDVKKYPLVVLNEHSAKTARRRIEWSHADRELQNNT